MLRPGKKVSFLARLGRWVCVCLPDHTLDDNLRARIKPLVIAGMACWCDKSQASKVKTA
ncbi:MAG: hypothetical protein KDI22_01165 [Gammaproteobacteria bacterium]|nr:hypothetical protein [Gammaproteobacteria bacterium]MCP5431342.1 hypothetical protein [Chromatiaceae bacterium]MCW5587470.1 hypothetical protein [Chromatiales bacterium]MCB1817624.1 hypothetical protein [Gammaproteobacteria bacterium]MCP5435842.1 hypothetical protein [Chromatiaceae bacterium]